MKKAPLFVGMVVGPFGYALMLWVMFGLKGVLITGAAFLLTLLIGKREAQR